MEFIKYFFRSNPEQNIGQNFQILHYSMLIVFILGNVILYKNREKINRNQNISNIIKNILIGIIFTVVISMYSWYIFTGYGSFKESLPLYHCRIIMILILIYQIKSIKILRTMIVNWGILGTIMALLFAETDPFVFPHITLYTFFAGHIAMGWYISYLFIKEGYEFNKKEFKNIVIITFTYNTFLLILNFILKSNYGYMNSSPFEIGELEKIYIPCIYIMYFLGNATIYYIGKKIQNRKIEL